MGKFGYFVFLSFLHLQVYCHSKDESIIIHSIKKRNVAEQLGPIPLRQREHPPLPIRDQSEDVYGQTAVLNPNLQDDGTHDPHSSIAGGTGSRSPLYGQFPSSGTQGDAQAPTYDYRQSQSYSSQSYGYGSEAGQADIGHASSLNEIEDLEDDDAPESRSGDSRTHAADSRSRTQHSETDPRTRTQTDPRTRTQHTQTDPRTRTQHTQTDPRTRTQHAQTDPRRRTQHTRTDPRLRAQDPRTQPTYTDPRSRPQRPYTDPRYTGASASYSPTGTGRQDPRVSTGTGPTGRRPPVAASYPLGPIVSNGGGEPLYRQTQTQTQRQVYRQTPGYRRTYTAQPVYTGGGQQYNTGQTYTGRQPTYTSGGQTVYQGGSVPVQTGGQPIYGQSRPVYTGSSQQVFTGRQPTYTVGGQPVYSSGQQQPVYNSGQGYPYGYYPQGGQQSYNPSCPETGIRMRINGMDCARAVDHYGPFLCYRHESTSRECCEKCQPLKNPNKVGCEYGDHSYQCRQIQAHDCYDLRNRQSCCETCDRLRSERMRTDDSEAGCEYGDMTPRCERVQQNPSLCYIPENQRLCCSTCRRLRGQTGAGGGSGSTECPWGDQNSNLCRPFDQYGGVRINCYAEPIRRLCCQTCERLKSRMRSNIPGCDYGDRPVIFNTGEYGSLNCTSFFRHFPTEQCQLNQAVSVNCCFTCHRYTTGRQRQPIRRPEEEVGRG